MALAGTIAPYHSKALPSGAVLREWTLEHVLGVGGFGIVYQGKGVYFDETVAIKEYFPSAIVERREDATVAPTDSSSEAVYALGLEKFVEEAKALWALSKPERHPNIVNVRSLFEVHGTAYMVMDFEAGAPLSEALRAGRRFSERELLAILAPIADGLDLAHKAGVLHRDIKPGNILIAEGGRPVLIDFGSARFASGDATSTGVSFYTAPYAALEQYVKTYPQGPWTDIYALGVVLYQCITGEKPPEVLERLHGEPGAPLAARRPAGFSPAFLRAVDAAMCIRPDARPRSLSEWLAMFLAEDDDATRVGSFTAEDITRIRASLTTNDWRALDPPAAPRRRLATAVGAGLLTLLAAASGFAIVVSLQRGTASAPRPPAPLARTAGRPAIATVAAVPDLDAAAAALGRAARAAGRSASEIAALDAGRATLAADAARARGMTAAQAAPALAALDADARLLARNEVSALKNAVAGDAAPGSVRSPRLSAAMGALRRSQAALDSDAAAAASAASASDALAVAQRAFSDYADARQARATAATALAGEARRSGAASAIARGEAAADTVLRMAQGAPRPWLFAPAAKKATYQTLQSAAASARAMRAEIAALSPGGANAIGRATALSHQLAALQRQAAAASQALR